MLAKPIPLPIQNWHLTQCLEGILLVQYRYSNAKLNVFTEESLYELELILDTAEKQLNSKTCSGLIIFGRENGFSAGVDIHSFQKYDSKEAVAKLLQRIHQLFLRIENFPLPTVAALDGFCLGGGLELALCCKQRIATPQCNLGLPEVKLGIYPGFGGTVRALRGPKPIHALRHILTGQTVSAQQAQNLGWIHSIVQSQRLIWAARQAVLNPTKAIPDQRSQITRIGLAIPQARKFIAQVISRKIQTKINPQHYPAPFTLIQLWQKYSANEKIMLKAERDHIPNLIFGNTSQGLQRLFLLREKLKAHKPLPKTRIGIIGAGTMGSSIAAWCVLQGFHVSHHDSDPSAVQISQKQTLNWLDKTLKRKAQAMGMDEFATKQFLTAAHACWQNKSKLTNLAHADIIIEAITENISAKKSLLQDLESKIKTSALLATNTSALNIDDIASALKHPERLIGLHFFNPAQRIPLVEVIRGSTTSAYSFQKAAQFICSLDKLPLEVANKPGFLVNRILAPYITRAINLISKNIHIEDIDAAAKNFGMPLGPIELVDRIGLDICLAAAEAIGIKIESDHFMRRMIDQGHLGLKTKQGFYRWNKDGSKIFKMISARKLRAPKIDNHEIIFPLIKACEEALQDGVVSDADFLDAGIVFATGFAPFTGGPLNYTKINPDFIN